MGFAPRRWDRWGGGGEGGTVRWKGAGGCPPFSDAGFMKQTREGKGRCSFLIGRSCGRLGSAPLGLDAE